MDLYCTNCGEPWEFAYIMDECQDDPEFKIEEESVICECPACKDKPTGDGVLAQAARARADKATALAEVLVGDPDGMAAMGYLVGSEEI